MLPQTVGNSIGPGASPAHAPCLTKGDTKEGGRGFLPRFGPAIWQIALLGALSRARLFWQGRPRMKPDIVRLVLPEYHPGLPTMDLPQTLSLFRAGGTVQFSPGSKGEPKRRPDATDKPRYPGAPHQSKKGVIKNGAEVPINVQVNQQPHGACEGRHFTRRAHKWRYKGRRSGVPFPFLASDLANRSTWRAVPAQWRTKACTRNAI